MTYVLEHHLSTRQFFVDLIDNLSTDELNQIPEGFSNNIIWNLLHSMVTQQSLMYVLSSLKINLTVDLLQKFRNGKKLEAPIDRTEIEKYEEMLL